MGMRLHSIGLHTLCGALCAFDGDGADAQRVLVRSEPRVAFGQRFRLNKPLLPVWQQSPVIQRISEFQDRIEMLAETDRFAIWLALLKDADPGAAQALWERFSARLLRLVDRRLAARRPRYADAEDVVNSVMRTLCRRAQSGQFQQLRDELDVWKLLVTIAERKAFNLLRDAGRQKRGGLKVRGDSALIWSGEDAGGLDALPSPEPTPEFAAIMVEATDSLIQLLDDESRVIVRLKLEGATNSEVARQIGRSVPTVERRLKLIRSTWQAWLIDHAAD